MRQSMNANPANALISAIYYLGIKNQVLIHKSLNLGLSDEARHLKHIDAQLMWLLQKSRGFDFISAIASGTTLLIGEGNLSFALTLAKNPEITASRLIATTYEPKTDLSDEAIANAALLRALGAISGVAVSLFRYVL